MMNLLRFYILNRLPIILVTIALGIVLHIYVDAITAWLLYIFAFFSLLLYFGLGTMRLVQEAVTAGDVDLAGQYLKHIKFPKLLFKPVRLTYYMLEGNLALVSNDLNKAESSIRQSLNTKSKLAGDTTGASLLQLGFVQLKKGDTKEARKTLMQAVKEGIPDKESLAAAYLQLCSIEIQRGQNRIAKEYFKKAKAQKPKSEEIKSQVEQLEKYIARLPG
jgi:tetratricopeptide (TPR) repeat protein